MNVCRWVLPAALVAFAGTAVAQTATTSLTQGTTLRGQVLDATGAPIPGADVVISSDGTEVAHLHAGHDGTFAFPGRAHEYTVELRAPGFMPLHSSPIPFTTTETTRFTLQAAATDVPGQTVGGPPARASTGILRQSPVHAIANRRPLDLGALVQGGNGVTDQRGGFHFLAVGAHLGKVLTPELGTGLLKGNFEYGVELFPYWGAYTPRFQKISCNADPGAAPGSYACSAPYTVGGTYNGVSVTPIQLRWNFTHGQRWMPWAQGAGGLVWTNHKFPAVGDLDPTDLASNGRHGDTSVWNFTPQFGVGTHLFLKPQQSLDFSANAVHLSSASLGDKNPGVNVSVQFTVGYSWWKQ